MKINVGIELGELCDDNGESLSDWVMDVIKREIIKTLKKHPEYQEYLNKQAEIAIKKIKNL